MRNKKLGKTHHAVALFVAAALVAAPGCSNTTANSNCTDQNGDGYCDNGGGSGSSGRYYGTYGTSGSSSGSKGTTSSDGSSGISQGTSGHGGIGSSGGSSSG